MTDLSQTIIAKSDQLNSDDLIGRSLTIEITDVTGTSGDQPISIHYQGDGGKPWKPCKSMRRVLVFIWGDKGKAYIGRRLTLFRDEKVKFGGMEVGGIRISHMSHMEKAITMALTDKKASKKPFVVQPLPSTPIVADATVDVEELKLAARTAALSGTETLAAHWKGLGATVQNKLKEFLPEWKALAAECDAPPAESRGEIADGETLDF